MGRKLETLRYVVAFMTARGRPVSSAEIAKELALSRRTVQRYLRLLKDSGFVKEIREGRSIKYVLLKPLLEEDLKRLAGEAEEGYVNEPDVYALAERTLEVLRSEAQIPADLLGAAKVHLTLPNRHRRITPNVDVIVPPEMLAPSAALLKVALGLVITKRTEGRVELRHPGGVKVRLYGGRIFEDGKVVLDLSEVLRERGELTLEEALVAKMTRRSFSYRLDAYDVAVALPAVDSERWKDALEVLKKRGDPSLVPRLFEAIEVVREFIKNESDPVEEPYLVKKLEALERVARETLSLNSQGSQKRR